MPNSIIPRILLMVHDSLIAGHPGRDRCLANTISTFWLKMATDITPHIEYCTTCSQLRGIDPRPLQIGEVPIPSEPWDTMCIEHLKLPPSHRGSRYVIAAVDYFSKYTILVPLLDK
ncbi:uncharacterized protein LOC143034291 [Oratosquilla oratoria]|uniref:uncharacterized protein LOC143034291 n=1 Tax=Oratosquilla oratoria TaxID=337810 RepID=UPI003F761559